MVITMLVARLSTTEASLSVESSKQSIDGSHSSIARSHPYHDKKGYMFGPDADTPSFEILKRNDAKLVSEKPEITTAEGSGENLNQIHEQKHSPNAPNADPERPTQSAGEADHLEKGNSIPTHNDPVGFDLFKSHGLLAADDGDFRHKLNELRIDTSGLSDELLSSWKSKILEMDEWRDDYDKKVTEYAAESNRLIEDLSKSTEKACSPFRTYGDHMKPSVNSDEHTKKFDAFMSSDKKAMNQLDPEINEIVFHLHSFDHGRLKKPAQRGDRDTSLSHH
uniref:AlNc14C73G4996 protein n=1 Tax=Albugo laibachii Nc14 TaxID=890382 RepID=F0WED9_9STRA|nr:AlNc14C73G4996 [Albugo laibachii Nc14]|eukprot:CCA19571.1 AlNc14C73G4996 [Albugo laibachii Nc14]